MIAHPEHKKVFFDRSGKFFFHAFELRKQKDDKKNTGLFGSGTFSHREPVPGDWNVDGEIKEEIVIGNPETEVVHTMSREDVLASDVEVQDETLASKVATASPEERAQIAAALGFTPEMFAALKSMTEKKDAPPAPPAGK